MIYTTIIILLAIFWIALLAMQHYAGQLIISPIIGIMFGALYDKEEDDEVYHTVQILLFVVALTFTWETNE
jgi:hypothetical protein